MLNEREEAQAELRAVLKMRGYLDQWEQDLSKVLEIKTRPSPTALHEGLVDALPWTESAKGFAWIFNTSREGSQLKETSDLAESIRSAPKGKLTIGRFVYTISPNSKFIQRKKV